MKIGLNKCQWTREKEDMTKLVNAINLFGMSLGMKMGVFDGYY